jgi:RNA polymerase sigma-70 factor (ECF subfamily)
MSTIEFNTSVISFRQALQYFALQLTRNQEEAKDLLQDTLYKAMLYRDKFADASNLKAWLYTIMKNTFINNYRRNIKTKQIVDSTKDLYYINIPQTHNVDNPISKISLKDVQRLIESLEDEFRQPFQMYFEGYKYKEIADDMDLPIGTVKSRIFLARKKLMGQLKDFV